MIYVKILRSLALALIILVLFSTRTLATNKIDEINKAIKAKGAKWVAGENWITRLSPEEQRQLFGALMEPPADAPLINIPIAANLPKHFD